MLHNSFYLLPELYQLIVLHLHQDRPSLPQDRLALLVKEYRQPKNILRSQDPGSFMGPTAPQPPGDGQSQEALPRSAIA